MPNEYKKSFYMKYKVGDKCQSCIWASIKLSTN